VDEGVRDGKCGGVSPPQPTSGSGERRNLSSPSASGGKRILVNFQLPKRF